MPPLRRQPPVEDNEYAVIRRNGEHRYKLMPHSLLRILEHEITDAGADDLPLGERISETGPQRKPITLTGHELGIRLCLRRNDGTRPAARARALQETRAESTQLNCRRVLGGQACRSICAKCDKPLARRAKHWKSRPEREVGKPDVWAATCCCRRALQPRVPSTRRQQ